MANKISWRDVANAAIDLTPRDVLRGVLTVGTVLITGAATAGSVVWTVSSKATEITTKQDDHAKQLAELTESIKARTAEAQQIHDRVVMIEARCCGEAPPPQTNHGNSAPATTSWFSRFHPSINSN